MALNWRLFVENIKQRKINDAISERSRIAKERRLEDDLKCSVPERFNARKPKGKG